MPKNWCVMRDASLMEAYAELRALLANPNTPEGVVSACLRLSEYQTKLFCTVSESYRQRIGRPSLLSIPGHLTETNGVCALSRPICSVNSSPHCWHLNGHGSSSSYMTQPPMGLHNERSPLPRLNQATAHHQTFQNPWRGSHHVSARAMDFGRFGGVLWLG